MTTKDNEIQAPRYFCCTPIEVENLLALHSLKVNWSLPHVSGRAPVGFIHHMEDPHFTGDYVCVSSDAPIAVWIEAVQRWERRYGQ
jgi:hypothetical protein